MDYEFDSEITHQMLAKLQSTDPQEQYMNCLDILRTVATKYGLTGVADYCTQYQLDIETT